MFKKLFNFLKNIGIKGYLDNAKSAGVDTSELDKVANQVGYSDPSISSGSSLQTGDIIGSLINTYTNAGLTGRDVALNQLALQNEHDKYGYQVSGMQDAGLNPALLYGAGSSGSPISVPASSSSSPMDFGQMLNAIILPAQIRNMEARTNKTLEETETEKKRQQEFDEKIKNLKATYNEILSRTDLNDTQQANLLHIGMYIDLMQEANLRYINSESALNNSIKNRIDKLLKGELKFQEMSIEDFSHKWDKIDGELDKMAAETKLLKRDLQDYAINHLHTPLSDFMRAWLENQADKNKNGYRDEDENSK